MNTINEENRNVNQENRRAIVDPSIPVLIIKVLITILFMSPLIHYSIYQKNSEHDCLQNATREGENSTTIEGNIKQTQLLVNKTMEKMVVQPSCPPANQPAILQGICVDLYLKYEQCTPGDFTNLEKHKLPKTSFNNKNNPNNNNASESRGMIISCFIGGLLLTSLGAAIVELYKAKYQQYTDDKQKLKTLMNRKCSLADLTVLKHNRKELMRRDSIMDIPEVGNGSTTINNKQLMGFKPAPLHRRCSFPVGPHEFTISSHQSDYRRSSIIDNSRRNSVIIDSRRSSIDCRRISVDESPERRHWSRLVHR